ncbi:tRNA (adenosine(37)-N6)-threonylcarbamoyltransferase complex dimerization subunit type 1 TsaB [Roseiconus nitratireducens]|uniref:tRNA (Adenosine(37)-N6)-threonylcarbamoyltransferase complex dimerization subunit type 1 TsaB n=1 Tax=Roseiconus nitratireducens TaxID=2605748 RepID=A0A5M6CVR0_9BACT|nr:tRNA (adenosine(37)-N6)-threonylcarbamoyltransferase complex dimerization subunit type 1 TsaB [Roseiconus nitratireducens]KAA5539311.1 tRNA (adenosine(37)-N6)-threonylcarbamoyltransferase complex dimerization subunit type 1 TsaB [Roseiconus nitratireducens]
MIQIALETTGKSGSLAVLRGEEVCWVRALSTGQRTAATLSVQLKAALGFCDQLGQRPDWVSVADGPGSFTGLRIAVTTAKTLGYALGVPVVPVGSLCSIAAAQCFDPDAADQPSRVLVGLNAYRGQVYAAAFDVQELFQDPLPIDVARRAEVVDHDRWDQWVACDFDTADGGLLGDRQIVPPQWEQRYRESVQPAAVGVGQIASRLVRAAEASNTGEASDPAEAKSTADAGNAAEVRNAAEAGNTEQQRAADPRIDPFDLVVRYLKSSAAEEKAARRRSIPGADAPHRSRSK